MDYRNLRRAFLFNRAAARFDLTHAQWWTLYAVHCLRYGTYSTILAFLSYNNRKPFNQTLVDNLRFLYAEGYLNKDRKVYSLTARGQNALSLIEKTVRKLRPDK